jgi:hypothetical protein
MTNVSGYLAFITIRSLVEAALDTARIWMQVYFTHKQPLNLKRSLNGKLGRETHLSDGTLTAEIWLVSNTTYVLITT